MIQLNYPHAAYLAFQRPKRFIDLLHRSMSEINRV